jgi:hypothetical protein
MQTGPDKEDARHQLDSALRRLPQGRINFIVWEWLRLGKHGLWLG